MSKIEQNDNRILDLKNKIEEKRNLIKSKDVRFAPITNCILELDSNKYNLHVLNYDSLIFLLVKLNMYKKSAEDLKLNVSIGGFDLIDWMQDVQSRIDKESLKVEIKNLKEMEDKLKKLLSSEKRTELELDEIEDRLK